MAMEKGTPYVECTYMGDSSDVMENHWGGPFCYAGCGNFKSTSILRLLEIVVFQYLKPGLFCSDFFFILCVLMCLYQFCISCGAENSTLPTLLALVFTLSL